MHDIPIDPVAIWYYVLVISAATFVCATGSAFRNFWQNRLRAGGLALTIALISLVACQLALAAFTRHLGDKKSAVPAEAHSAAR